MADVLNNCKLLFQPKDSNKMKVDLQQIKTDFKGEICYVHARGAVTPQGFGVITTQPLRLSGDDIFYGMEMLTSSDCGRNWSDFRKSSTLVRRSTGEAGYEEVFCDATPFYHKKTGKLIITGHNALYLNDELAPTPRRRYTVWSVWDEKTADWQPWQKLQMPDDDAWYSCGSGCGQIVELDNGELLIPVYYASKDEAAKGWEVLYKAQVLRCSFDGSNIGVLEVGNSLAITEPRGLCEPSVTEFNGKYLLALRNDVKGYVTVGTDGLNYEAPRVLCFDDNEEVGNYCTQQHWFKCGGRLFMVYTRRNANNDHVFRHRAPLFFAEFDTEKMCLIRSTEQIAVPERGARLGNFGCVNISENEAWVIAAEWMQTTSPDSKNWRRCMSYGSDNSIFIARITPQ